MYIYIHTYVYTLTLIKTEQNSSSKSLQTDVPALKLVEIYLNIIKQDFIGFAGEAFIYFGRVNLDIFWAQ